MNVRALIASDLSRPLQLYSHLNPTDAPLPHSHRVDACTICVVPNLTRGCRPYALIENVVTSGAHRRKGWGKAVLSEALAFAWSQDCYKVMLLSGRKDDGVLRFYEAAGFNPDEKRGFIARSVT